MSGYRLRPKAVEDLETIGDFIAADNPAKAVAFVDDLIAVCSRIAEQPRAFQRRDDIYLHSLIVTHCDAVSGLLARSGSRGDAGAS